MNRILFLMILAEFLFSGIAAIYFYRTLRGKGPIKPIAPGESKREMEKLSIMRGISLTPPLAEQIRPKTLQDIIGQEKGIQALRAALCGPNPQHVLIYGSPGVGKTAAARLILEEAKHSFHSPFLRNAKFVELDATILHFDERSIADPLMGSVHDPIYQGAGIYGTAGVPQPKPGAVTKAHGGILFIDEIGELHPMQMNKLLKVLEDRVVYFQSSYYSETNGNIPEYIHNIFQHGLPADFRLVGATTRSPEEIPPALRSRCTEIYFEDLKREDFIQIAKNSVKQAQYQCDESIYEKVADYATNGRDAVNMIQTAISYAFLEKRNTIEISDLEQVIENGKYQPLPIQKIGKSPEIGVVNGLAVLGSHQGTLMPIEACAKKADIIGNGKLQVTGIIEQEEMKGRTSTFFRKSTALSSVENVLTALENITGLSVKDYDIHIHFSSGFPVDGPSAGGAIFCAVYSAISGKEISNQIAITGEVNLKGRVLPVGGVSAKIKAAIEAGAKTVFIPEQNWQENFISFPIHIVQINHISQLLNQIFDTASSSPDKMEQTICNREYFPNVGTAAPLKAKS